MLLIFASQVARITGVSHWCPAEDTFLIKKEDRTVVN
jgi:hypothetical protein